MLLAALATVWFASPLIAQQATPPAAPAAAPAAPALASPAVEAAAKAPVATGEHDLSPWAMFMGADIIVKAVMVGLALASVLTWTVGIFKMMELTWAMRRLKAALRKIGESR